MGRAAGRGERKENSLRNSKSLFCVFCFVLGWEGKESITRENRERKEMHELWLYRHIGKDQRKLTCVHKEPCCFNEQHCL